MSTPTDDTPSTGFASLGLSPKIVSAVAALGYEEPTPIQREAIPLLLEGRDVIGLAGTGTGKTAAFALPLLDRLAREGGAKGRAVRALILVPTRELAMQVSEALHKYARQLRLGVVPLYGGASMELQIRALRRGADVVVATPGRALDHLRRETLALSAIEVLVLDEADEMLDMGFADDIDALIGATPATRQTALFAATMAPRIAAITGTHLRSPSHVTIAREKRQAGKLPRIRQTAYIVGRPQKMAALGRILDFEDPASAIVFCRTRVEVDELTTTLQAHGFSAQALHGGMAQAQRDRVMESFRKELTDILVATDVAARGLDIEHVSHVINFDVPTSPEVYVHRIGRTGRIGREGVAITLANPREHRFLRTVEALTKQKIDVQPLPSLADLRARRLETTRDALREHLAAGDFGEARAIVESLAQEFDVLDVAAAAVKMVHDGNEPARPEADVDIAQPDLSAERRGARDREPRVSAGPRASRRTSSADGPMAVVFIGAGKNAGVRPGDLVGAIAGEAGVPSSVIGSIRVGEGYSLVEVPEAMAATIMAALRATKIRGQRVTVRRDRDQR